MVAQGETHVRDLLRMPPSGGMAHQLPRSGAMGSLSEESMRLSTRKPQAQECLLLQTYANCISDCRIQSTYQVSATTTTGTG